MTEERAIEKCQEMIKRNNKIVKEARKVGDTNTIQLVAELDIESLAMQTVLNMLEEKDKKIESKNRLLQIVGIELNEAETKIEEKDKIIDLMAEYIATLDIEEDICKKTGKDLNKCDCMALCECENCIKQYYKSKVEKE